MNHTVVIEQAEGMIERRQLPRGWEGLRERGEELRAAAWRVYVRGLGEYTLYRLAEMQTGARARRKGLAFALSADGLVLRDGYAVPSERVLEILDEHAAEERGLACA